MQVGALAKVRRFQLPEIRRQDVSTTLVETLKSKAETRLRKNKAGVLEMNLSRIEPDLRQPRRILPSKLHDRLREGVMLCQEIMERPGSARQSRRGLVDPTSYQVRKGLYQILTLCSPFCAILEVARIAAESDSAAKTSSKQCTSS